MKATKKIVGAACALVAAVALSAGSTFAWFSSNEKVEVTGMRLQAVVPDALFIKQGRVTEVASITETSLDFADTAETKLHPATIAAKESATGTYEVKSAATYTEGNKPTGNSAGVAATYDVHGTFDNTSTAFTAATDKVPGDYATMYTMSLARINNKEDEKLQAIVVFTFDDDEGDNTYKFVRCGFLSETGWVSIPNTEATGVCAYDTTEKTVTFTYKGTNAVVSDFDGNKAYPVQFVVWFDGPDTDCFVNNALTTHNITVQITYSVEVDE